MRQVQDSQFELGQVPIADIQFDPKHRDDIPAVLAGLQAVYLDEKARTGVFEILKKHVRPEADHHRGRPGMVLWRIFVLGVLKQALKCDFDRLQSLACSYVELRQMLGHADIIDRPKYALQTIIDNVSLLTEEVLLEINQVVVQTQTWAGAPSKSRNQAFSGKHYITVFHLHDSIPHTPLTIGHQPYEVNATALPAIAILRSSAMCPAGR